MALNTRPIQLATTGLIPHPSAPYQRATAVRHRKAPEVWVLQSVARRIVLWLAQPVRVRRGIHAAYFAATVTSSLVAVIAVAVHW